MNQIDRYTCEQVFQRLDNYIDRELSDDEMKLVQEHIEICAWCAKTYSFEVKVLNSMRDRLQKFRVPSDLLSKVSLALDAAESES